MIDPAPCTLVLVEDDDVAAEAVIRGLERAGLTPPVVWVQDGQAALQVLRGRDPLRQAPRPRVVLLDLNMPGMSGLEFLQQLRADGDLRHEVVFVLTTSDSATDRELARQANVAAYFVKGSAGQPFTQLAQLIQSCHSTVPHP